LSNHFVTIRAEVRGKEEELNERSSIPITIRQLEAIIRISESLAKMSLTPTVLDVNFHFLFLFQFSFFSFNFS